MIQNPRAVERLSVERVDFFETLQAEISLREFSLEYKGFRARRSPRQPFIGAVFAVHARENRIFKSEGEYPPLTTPRIGL